jgi:hypothetical protein
LLIAAPQYSCRNAQDGIAQHAPEAAARSQRL